MTVLAAPPIVDFVCPRCRSPLEDSTRAYWCGRCRASYPLVAGIPDFRVAADPWLSIDADRAKALRLVELTAGSTFADAVRLYWEITPATPRELAARFTDHVLSAEQRSSEWLDLKDAKRKSVQHGPHLDLGCGTADLALNLARRGTPVIAADIALRWLVVARKRLQEAGHDVPLVCCCAERLPFPAETFSRTVALGLLEHCEDAEAVVLDAHRTLGAGGEFHTRSVNRFTLLREPHVGVWGIGFLPRKWADGYVRWRTGERYLFHHPRSERELRHVLRRAGFESRRVEAAPMLPGEIARLGAAAKHAVPVYRMARRTPGFRRALTAIAPLLEASGRKPS